ncbi:RHOMBOID-like protein 12, mitochondrial isoform X1 [Vigna unguiculata]|uniref:RHOMBOID-like protein 12, mitochondrial isoform X1 n=1 Tax=Vigna unguiculata TaxID=3917 RepID=UPI0010167C6C|nr:RHOMBOID-like protein 12, mitochondrial isoform X1 [Vigna unguiculata]
MQNLVRRVVKHHPHGHPKCHSIFNTFSSVLKPSQPQLHQRIHIPSSFLTHQSIHFHSCRSFSTKLRPFLSRPTTSRCFAFNSLLGLRARSLSLDHRPILHYFRRHNFNFNYNNEFSWRSWRSWLRGLTSNDVVLGLIIANVGIFLLWRIADEKFMIKNFTISLDNIKSGRLHTLITNAFSHVDTWHIISNMIGLYFFGMNVGRNFGPEFLLKLYLAGAIVGAGFYLMHQAFKAQTSKDWKAMIVSRELALGASGAVNAVMLLDIFLFPKATIYLDFFIPVPAILLGIFFIGKDMLRILEGDSKVAGSVHLGGAVVAAIAWAGVRRGRF